MTSVLQVKVIPTAILACYEVTCLLTSVCVCVIPVCLVQVKGIGTEMANLYGYPLELTSSGGRTQTYTAASVCGGRGMEGEVPTDIYIGRAGDGKR